MLVAVAEDYDKEFDARDYLFICMQGCHHTLLPLLLLHLLQIRSRDGVAFFGHAFADATFSVQLVFSHLSSCPDHTVPNQSSVFSID